MPEVQQSHLRAHRGGEARNIFVEAFAVAAAVGHAMRITLVNMFRKPVTVHYPTTTRRFPDRFRGLLALTYDKETGEENCIGCRLCEFICPPAVIKVEMLKGEKRNYAKLFTLELYACEFCELCVQVCPTDAIIMMKSFDMSTSDRREMLLDKDRLHAIGLQHAPSWATGTKLRDMQAPPKKEAGSGKPEAGSGKQEAGSGKPEAGSGKPEAGSGKPEAGSGKPEAGSGKPEAGSGTPA